MDTITEKSTCTIYATLYDSAGAVIGPEAISTFKATLYLKGSAGTILNSRTAVDLRVGGNWTAVNGMSASVSDAGRVAIHLSSADNAMSVATATSEIHVLMIEIVTTGVLPETRYQNIEFEVLNLLKVT